MSIIYTCDVSQGASFSLGGWTSLSVEIVCNPRVCRKRTRGRDLNLNSRLIQDCWAGLIVSSEKVFNIVSEFYVNCCQQYLLVANST